MIEVAAVILRVLILRFYVIQLNVHLKCRIYFGSHRVAEAGDIQWNVLGS